MSVVQFSVMNIEKQTTAEKFGTNMRKEAEQYSYGILENWMIPSLNILINNILFKKECRSISLSSRIQENFSKYRKPIVIPKPADET